MTWRTISIQKLDGTSTEVGSVQNARSSSEQISSHKEANKTADKRVCKCCWKKAQLDKMFGAANELDNW